MRTLFCRQADRLVGLLLLSLLAVLSCSSCGPAGEGEVHLLPRGFVGPVLIIFNQSDGAAREYKRGKRIYRIPSSGVLRTQFPTPASGIVPAHFYYAVNDSVVAELRELIGSEEASAGSGTYVLKE